MYEGFYCLKYFLHHINSHLTLKWFHFPPPYKLKIIFNPSMLLYVLPSPWSQNFVISQLLLFQTTSSRHKLSTMVQFPVSGLDLSTYVEHNQNQNNQSGSQMKINLINNLTRWSQWRTASSNNRRPSISSNGQDCIYDLHAVCNHVGSLSGGHYTGNQWIKDFVMSVSIYNEDLLVYSFSHFTENVPIPKLVLNNTVMFCAKALWFVGYEFVA